MSVSVDGIPRLSATVSKRYETYRKAVSIKAGVHRIKVRYLNDHKSKRCDRDLYVDDVALLPAGAPTPTPTWTPDTPPVSIPAVPGSTPTPPVSTPAPPVPTPAPPVTTPTPPANAFADVFSTDLASRGLTDFRSVVNGHRIEIVDDPVLGAARKVLKFKVYQTDLASENPRAQLETPYDFNEGDDRYFGFSFFFPSDFPAKLPPGGWVTLASMAYGPPFGGAGPVGIRVQNANDGSGAQVRWQRGDAYGNDIPWSGPRIADVKNRWVDFVIRMKLSRDPSVGFVELYTNTGSGWVHQKLKGQDRLYMVTRDAGISGGPDDSRINLYYRKDIPGPLTVYQGSPRLASAGPNGFAAVAPHSYR